MSLHEPQSLNTTAQCLDNNPPQLIQTHQTEQAQEPTSWKTAIIHMLPSNNPSLMGMIVQITFIVIGIVNYAHTQSIEGFLAIYGAGSIGSTGVQHATRRIPFPKGDQSHAEGQ